MKDKTSEFKEKYKIEKEKAVSKFKDENKLSLDLNALDYMCQVMATVGLEMESKFGNNIVGSDNFLLFGRRKSEKSINKKKKIAVQDYKNQLKDSIKNDKPLPKEVRSIYDFYGFKLVCSDIYDVCDVIEKIVIKDFLNDIIQKDPSKYEEIKKMAYNYKDITSNTNTILVKCISEMFEEDYPNFQKRFDNIQEHKAQVVEINNFLDNTRNLDLSNTTYKEYYNKIIDCYSILEQLTYEESHEEKEKINKKIYKNIEKLEEIKEKEKENKLLPDKSLGKYEKKLNKLLLKIDKKKFNKLDLSVGSFMVFDVLMTSNQLKKLGVQYSKDPTRTKEKRMPNGYIADFYSLDLPKGLKAELQVQSGYRFEYGEKGPAAHNKMPNNLKKRTLYKTPKKKKDYFKWEKRQFKSLPQYFNYWGNGRVTLFSNLDNFRKYYDCEDPRTVSEYVKYMLKCHPDLLFTKTRKFSLDDKSLLEAPNSKPRDIIYNFDNLSK